jgi:hypothetical protein
MIDLGAVVGWSLSDDMTAENSVVKAWCHAWQSRSIAEGFLLYSDRGRHGMEYNTHATDLPI